MMSLPVFRDQLSKDPLKLEKQSLASLFIHPRDRVLRKVDQMDICLNHFLQNVNYINGDDDGDDDDGVKTKSNSSSIGEILKSLEVIIQDACLKMFGVSQHFLIRIIPVGSFAQNLQNKESDLDLILMVIATEETLQSSKYNDCTKVLLKIANYMNLKKKSSKKVDDLKSNDKNDDNFVKISDIGVLHDALIPIMTFNFEKNQKIDLQCCILSLPQNKFKYNLLKSLKGQDWIDFCMDQLVHVDVKSSYPLSSIIDMYYMIQNILLDNKLDSNLMEETPCIPQSFRLYHHAIIYWAKQRDMYSHGLGYLGGFSWRILIIYAFKEFTQKSMKRNTSIHLIYHFFKLFHDWKWCCPKLQVKTYPNDKDRKSTKNMKAMPSSLSKKVDFEPVCLTEESKQKFITKYKYNKDKPYNMHIIAPSPPHNNSSRNMTRSTYYIMMKEFKRAYTICEKYLQSDSDIAIDDHTVEKFLQELTQKANRINEYPMFFKIDISAGNSIDYAKWKSLCESKVAGWCRYKIEPLLDRLITVPLTLEPTQNLKNNQKPCEGTLLIGICILKEPFTISIHNNNNNCGAICDMDLKSPIIKQLPLVLAQFISQVYEWKSRNEGMHLSAQVISRNELPKEWTT